MKTQKYIMLLLIVVVAVSCKNVEKNKKELQMINETAKTVQNYIHKDVVIAHRGTTYWAPEETEPAFLWARNIGADYLELDIQMTKDSILIALHDDTLERTTNVSEIFPSIKNPAVDNFTLKELRSLDAGSWFNKTNPKRARTGFVGLKVLTLQDVIMFAEGYRIKKENGEPVKEIVNSIWTGKYEYVKDPSDNGNRPGVYIETKHPKLNIEKHLSDELTMLGWNINTNPKEIQTIEDKVGIGNTKARVILQSFSPESIMNLETELPNIPKCFLLWKPDMKGDLKEQYQKAIDFGLKYNVQIIGSSISGEPNNYEELTTPWMTEMIHKAGLLIHPYTFDTTKQLNKYKGSVEGVFTNRAELALEFYNRKSDKSPEEILDLLGY
ncbi:MAG: glycerophosphodiester phosphodiesterase family protein [Flavobacteriaceae bacterium]